MANCVRCGRKLPPFTFGRKVCVWCVRHEAAQRGEITEDQVQPIIAPPWVRQNNLSVLTKVFLGINVAVFVAMTLGGASISGPTGQQLVDWGANWGPATLSGQWWRLLTNVFIHIGILHIGFNMWCLWDLGALCESLYGRGTFGMIYLLSGIGGSIASIGWDPTRLSAGASGAIFGLAGALIASFYLGEFNVPRAVITGSLRSVMMFAGYNLVFGAISRGIDNSAHIGGLVTGLVTGALIARLAPDQNNILRRAAVLGTVLVAVLGAVVWVYAWRGNGHP